MGKSRQGDGNGILGRGKGMEKAPWYKVQSVIMGHAVSTGMGGSKGRCLDLILHGRGELAVWFAPWRITLEASAQKLEGGKEGEGEK